MSFPIVVSEPDRPVTHLRLADGGWQSAELAPSGHWPAWRPGHEAISVSIVSGLGDERRSAVELLDLEGNHLRSLFESPSGVDALIAPNVPHYALWSPTGEVLALVAQGRAGLTLFLSEADGPIIADPIQTGGPLFLAWSPDGRRLAVHAGVNLSVLELAEARASRPISADARGFRTPAFSDDGELLAFATPDASGDGVALRVAGASGESSRVLDELPGGVSLAFRPGSRTLTVAVTRRPASGAFDELWAFDLGASGEAELLIRRPFAGFFWDPTGEKFALVVVASTGDGTVSLHARSGEGEFLGASPPFLPSADYQTAVGFFDQYGRSHPLWAPDGSLFLAGGRLLTDSRAAMFGDRSCDAVMVWAPGRGVPFDRVSEGGIGVFPPPLSRPLT